MTDKVHTAFLEGQFEAGMALAVESDLLELHPQPGTPPSAYVAEFRCKGLVEHDGDVREASQFYVGISFPDDYLRRFNPFEVLTWLGPGEIWHPNIRAPHICLGVMPPGTSLPDLLYQCFEIITFHNLEMREPQALNHAACAWARHHVARFPVDTRPLKRRTLELSFTP